MTDERNGISDEDKSRTIDRSILSAAGLLRCETCGEPTGCDDRFCGSCGSHLHAEEDLGNTATSQLQWFDGIWRAVDTLPAADGGLERQISDREQAGKRRSARRAPTSDRSRHAPMAAATRLALAREARRRFRRSVLWLLGTGAPLVLSYGPGSAMMPARWLLVGIAAYGCIRFARGVRVLARPELLFDDGLRQR